MDQTGPFGILSRSLRQPSSLHSIPNDGENPSLPTRGLISLQEGQKVAGSLSTSIGRVATLVKSEKIKCSCNTSELHQSALRAASKRREAALVLDPSSRESFCQAGFWQWRSLPLQILATVSHPSPYLETTAPPASQINTLHCTRGVFCLPASTEAHTAHTCVGRSDDAVKLCSRKQGRSATAPGLRDRPTSSGAAGGSPSPDPQLQCTIGLLSARVLSEACTALRLTDNGAAPVSSIFSSKCTQDVRPAHLFDATCKSLLSFLVGEIVQKIRISQVTIMSSCCRTSRAT